MTAATLSAADKADPVLKLGKETNLWRDAWLRLLRNKLAVFGGCVVLFFLFLAIFADFVAPYHYETPILVPVINFPIGTTGLAPMR